MRRARLWLVLLLVGELLLGGGLVVRRLRRPAPPRVDARLLDPITAGQIRAAAATCESAEEWRRLGELYMAVGCFRESEICHRVASELAPSDAQLARQWGFALERLALLEEANGQYRRAIELGAADPDACRYFIGRNLLRGENPREARAVFAEGQSLPANRYELARLHCRAGEFAEAFRLLQTLAPTHGQALQTNLLGYRIAREQGDSRRAFLHADQARYAPHKLLSPFDEEAQRIVTVNQTLGAGKQWAQGKELLQAGQLEAAERMLSEAAQVFHSPAIQELQAECALLAGRLDEGIRLLEAFQDENGRSARLIARIGDAQDSQEDTVKARASWLRALDLGSGLDLTATHLKLAQSFRLAGNQEQSERHFGFANFHAGRELLPFGPADRVVELFRAAVKQNPDFPEGWFYLGEACRRAGMEQEAAAAYRQCLQRQPYHGRARAGLAFLTGMEK